MNFRQLPPASQRKEPPLKNGIKPYDAATVPMTDDKREESPAKPRNDVKVHTGMLPPDYITSDGRYQVLELLGQGGMGTVYRAIDRTMGIEVAMKFLSPGADDTAKGLFETEARAMARLAGCANIVTIFNLGSIYVTTEDRAERVPFISCEYLKGGSVQDLIGKLNKERPLDEIIKCIKIGIQAASGLARAHQEGILHRDVKPSNLLLRTSGTVKISDFGLAKFLLEPTGRHTARDRHTVAFMAPEQKDIRLKPNAKIDIYQLGVTLYYLLTGRFPHNTRFETPFQINSNIPERISNYVLKMMEFQPGERPVDCREVADTLQAELDQIEHGKAPAEPTDILHLEQFRKIRHALKEKFEKGVKLLTKSEHRVVLPRKKEKQRWYATLLLRPYQQRADGSKKLLDRFNPIYFADHRGARRVAFSDWEKDAHLISRSLSINACCSGLPIRWYREEENWPKDGDFFHVEPDKHNFIPYFALKNIKFARFQDPGTNIIKDTYATDMARTEWPRAVGWDMETENGDKRPMSQDIQTEILIPIYNPLSKGGRWVNDSDILGVANFEWEEQFSDHRIEEVGNYLSNLIQDENCFAVSEFTCDVLPNITFSDYDDGDSVID
jgi:serine/threonine protein kinase